MNMQSLAVKISQKPNLAFSTLIRTALAIYDQPDPTFVLGIDTSHYTKVVNWQIAKENGIRFVIIKFMDGKYRTQYAEENYKGAKDAGILVGSYQWLRKATEVSPGGQAREYLAMLADHPCDIRPAVDFEWSPNGKAYNVDTGELWGFTQPFEAGYGKKPMIYTAWGYWDEFGSPASMWADYPLWTAQYRVKQPKLFGPWTQWKFWQWTATGEGARYGVPSDGEKAVDLNYWCGTLEDLQKWCGANITPPDDKPTGPVYSLKSLVINDGQKDITLK